MSAKEELNQVVEAQYGGFADYLKRDLPEGDAKEQALSDLNDSQFNAHLAVDSLPDPEPVSADGD